MSITYRIISLLVLLLLLSACSFSLAEDITPPPGAEVPALPSQPAQVGEYYPLVPPDPEDGKLIYQELCVTCHGATGQGNGPQASQLSITMPALDSVTLARQASPSDWYASISQGSPDKTMPSFSSLSERDRWNVVAYLFTLSSSPDEIIQGKQLYTTNCVECHGEQAKGDGPKASSLASSPANLTNQELMAQSSGTKLYEVISTGTARGMPAFSTRLSEIERWRLVSYLRTLSFVFSEEAGLVAGTPLPEEGETPIPTEPLLAEQAETGMGTVTGKINTFSETALPADLVVTLHGFDEMQPNLTATAVVGADGSFRFEKVAMPVGRLFVTSIKYQQVIYGSEIAIVETENTNLDLPITVYETTTDPKVLSVDRLHIFFEYIGEDTLRVAELYVISNLSDRTLVAKQEGDPVITFDLPAGATNLKLDEGALGDRFVQTPTGFGDTIAIRPGMSEHQVMYSFDIPYKRRFELAQRLTLPVNAVVILLPEDGLKVKSDLLQDAGKRDVQGVAYHMYSSEKMEAGQELYMVVSGRPAGGGLNLVAGSTSSLVIGVGILGLTLIVVGVWLYRRARARISEVEEVESLVEPSLAGEPAFSEPEEAMDAIIALDERYRAGDLPIEAYGQRRAVLKAQLKELLKSQDVQGS